MGYVRVFRRVGERERGAIKEGGKTFLLKLKFIRAKRFVKVTGYSGLCYWLFARLGEKDLLKFMWAT